jgi:hypothetical protein
MSIQEFDSHFVQCSSFEPTLDPVIDRIKLTREWWKGSKIPCEVPESTSSANDQYAYDHSLRSLLTTLP